MRNRYQKPAPSLEFLELYQRYAQPTRGELLAEPDAAEARRVEGVASMLALARSALANADEWANMTLGGRQRERGTRLGAIPSQLRSDLAMAGLRILVSDDPGGELQSFLGQKPRGLGRPAEDLDHRNFMITVDVAELHANGMTVPAAIEEVSQRPGTPGIKRIEAIYLARHKDPWVRAELEWRSGMRIEAVYLAPRLDPADRAELERRIRGRRLKARKLRASSGKSIRRLLPPSIRTD
jgi:hypothetical protein